MRVTENRLSFFPSVYSGSSRPGEFSLMTKITGTLESVLFIMMEGREMKLDWNPGYSDHWLHRNDIFCLGGGGYTRAHTRTLLAGQKYPVLKRNCVLST